ncbi:AAA family ATPase [Exiguobacterium sp. R-17]|uniref:AAA family ATPase n=1 Tax=Exiguobacterium sp. R-17 TaxID=3404054 RepID=UPI003CF71C9D
MKLQQLKDQLNSIYLGKPDVIDLCLTALIAEGHILLEDVPGTGKTMLAKALAQSFESAFSRIQFTADLLPSDVIGSDFFNLKTQEFENKHGPLFANVVLIDEINRAVPRTQSALLEAMEERQVSIGGTTYQMPAPFFVIATQNPIESAGTFPLPDAQLDRFMVAIEVGYPDFENERRLLSEILTNVRRSAVGIASGGDLISWQEEARRVHASQDVLDYLLHIVQATRNHELIEVGVSPRGAIALLRASQSYAFLNQRDFIIPEDIKYLAKHVLSHRLTLTLEGGIKTTKAAVLTHILDDVPVPVEMG